ncbi:hypothetical protein NCLIV_001100 [Neospora caninum Liverpool]|uniref:Tetratricopeptide repeat-containing protein n=1 Tax=Neospora caninum (strain Liverpool) TaxID=572307 RepID=F0V7C5_NEOCL|nr:hypothetical protein NCLIV_001100 [Neospora caninum Liverpool]CBZ49616.1 hypothetical protein NCLIV_001100 [Neospora caninum Liverpool]|eukprot:XP_003879651.1 hypothetical protein NCLIV_001100 [Neospora caninum Liverpool]
MLLPLAPPSPALSSPFASCASGSFSLQVGELAERLLTSSVGEVRRETHRGQHGRNSERGESPFSSASRVSRESPSPRVCVSPSQASAVAISTVTEAVRFFLRDAFFQQAAWGLLHRGLGREAQRMLAACPGYASLWLCLGKAMLRSGRLQEALEFLNSEVPFEDLPSHIAAPLHLLLAEVYDDLGAIPHGTEALCAAANFLPETSLSGDSSALARPRLSSRGKEGPLAGLYSETKREDLSFAVIGALWRLIGHARLDPEEEERVLSRLAIPLSPTHGWWLVNARWQSRCCFRSFDFETANSLCDFVLARDPTDVDALALKASSLHQLGATRTSELEEFARRLRRMQGNAAVSAFVTGKARLLGAVGDPEELRKAAEFFSEAVSLLCEHHGSATLFFSENEDDDRRRQTKPSSSPVSSFSPSAWFSLSLLPTQRTSLACLCFEALARTYAELGESRVAIRHLLRAIRLQPRNHRVYLHLGMQELEESEGTPEPSLRSQMLSRAEMYLTQALEMQPLDPFVYNELARLHAARNRMDCSVWYLERAVLCSVRTAASPALFLSNLGLAYLRTQAFKKAERTFEAALRSHLRVCPAASTTLPFPPCFSFPQFPRLASAAARERREETRDCATGHAEDAARDTPAEDATEERARRDAVDLRARTARNEAPNGDVFVFQGRREEAREGREEGEEREGRDFIVGSSLFGPTEEREREDEERGFITTAVGIPGAPSDPFEEREETESEKKDRIFAHNLWLGLGVALYVQGNPRCVGPLERALRLAGGCNGKSQSAGVNQNSAYLTFLLYTAAIEEAPLLFPSLSRLSAFSLPRASASGLSAPFLSRFGAGGNARERRRLATAETGREGRAERQRERTGEREDRGEGEGASIVGKKRRFEGETGRCREEVESLLDDVLDTFSRREREREARKTTQRDEDPEQPVFAGPLSGE